MVAARDSGLPLPLGVNVIRRDLGADALATSRTSFAMRSSAVSTIARRRSSMRSSSAAASMRPWPIASSPCTSTSSRRTTGTRGARP
jgi:hypothetical protein